MTMIKHFITCIIFMLLWVVVGSGMEGYGIDSRQAYMLVGGLFGIAIMGFFTISED